MKRHHPMPPTRRRSLGLRLLAPACAGLMLAAVPAAAEIRELRGQAETLIIQRLDGTEVQRDFNQEFLPGTTAILPLITQARLEKVVSVDVLGAGQGVALLHRLPSGTTDVGIDLGAFSEDPSTSWYGSSTVAEIRSIVLAAGDLPGGRAAGDTAVVTGRVRLSGIMLITATSTTEDLTGAEVRLNLSITQRDAETGSTTVLDGEVRLLGGPGRDVRIGRASGAFAATPPAIAALPELAPDMPLVRAVLFTGQELPYEYSVTAGRPFELELNTRVQVFTVGAGIGTAAAFGNPVEGLPSILEKVKRGDAAGRLVAVVGENVDTTGAAYAQPPVPWPQWPALCGVLGLESLLVPLLMMHHRRRPTRRRARRA